jgi:threonine/homoserine/homoserine lactone efflux protein
MTSAFFYHAMGASFLVRGAVIGLAIAAPVCPIGVLCIRRTLAEGRLSGLMTGLGAATADACYGSMAAFGLTAAGWSHER